LIENVTCQLSDADKFSEYFITAVTIFFSFLIAYGTIIYTEQYRQKKDFKTFMNLFKYEFSALTQRLNQLKTSLEKELKDIKGNPKSLKIFIIPFPPIENVPYNAFISNGYWSLISKEDYKFFSEIKLDIEDLIVLGSRFERKTNVICVLKDDSRFNIEESNEEIIKLFEKMIEKIDNLSEKEQQFQDIFAKYI
jgi:hypothetical protein